MKACIERKPHTQTHWTKSEESLETTAKRVVIKTSVCQGSRNIHTHGIFAKIHKFVFFFLCGRVSVTSCPFHHFVSVCPTSAVAQNGAARKATWSLPFSHFSWSRVLSFPRLLPLECQQAAGWTTEEKSFYKDKSQSPGVLKEGDVT